MAELRVDSEEGQLYWNGKALYRDVLRKLPETWEDACLYVLPGPGLGLGVPEIIAKLPVTSRLLLLEWDPELAEFSMNYLMRHLGGYFEPLVSSVLQSESMAFLPLLAGYDGGNLGLEGRLDYAISRLYQFLQGNERACWQNWCFRRVRVLPLSRAFALQRQAFLPVLDWLESYTQNFWQNRLTLDKLGPLWLRNFFRNLAQLPYCQPVQLQSTNVVLVAAGPSLEQHYAWLRHERSHFTLICVDTALLPLLRAQIVPDYVMNLDAQILNLEDFYGAAHLVSSQETGQETEQEIVLTQVADLSCDPRSFTVIQSPFVLTRTEFAPMRLWLRFAELQERMSRLRQVDTGPLVLEPLGSVGGSSLAVALQSRPKFLLFVGYDFAYPKDLHHVRGTSIHQKLLQKSNRFQPLNSFVATLLGPLLEEYPSVTKGFCTDRVLLGYAQQLQSYLRRHCRVDLVARLDGLMELSGIKKLAYEQASAALRQNTRSNQVQSARPAGQECQAVVREFWQSELQILQRLQHYIQGGDLDNAALWWYSENYAADYLLRLCLPRAGYSEAQCCNWPKLLQLSQDFGTLLGALIEEFP